VRTIGGWLLDGGDSRHLLLVGLLALGSADDPLRAVGLDHRDAFAVDRGGEDFAHSRLDRVCRAGGVEALEVNSGLLHDLLGRALGHGRAGYLSAPSPEARRSRSPPEPRSGFR